MAKPGKTQLKELMDLDDIYEDIKIIYKNYKLYEKYLKKINELFSLNIIFNEDDTLLKNIVDFYYAFIKLYERVSNIIKIDIRTLEDFKKIGYHCVIYPVSTLRIAMKAIDFFFNDLKAN